MLLLKGASPCIEVVDHRAIASLSPLATCTNSPAKQVVFERFWWDRNADDRPTGAPPGATADGAAGGGATVVDWFVQAAGKAMFFDGLSVFPVRYLDDDLCVFEFKAAGTVVASLRVG